jgi:hypothetical protein
LASFFSEMRDFRKKPCEAAVFLLAFTEGYYNFAAVRILAGQECVSACPGAALRRSTRCSERMAKHAGFVRNTTNMRLN